MGELMLEGWQTGTSGQQPAGTGEFADAEHVTDLLDGRASLRLPQGQGDLLGREPRRPHGLPLPGLAPRIPQNATRAGPGFGEQTTLAYTGRLTRLGGLSYNNSR